MPKTLAIICAILLCWLPSAHAEDAANQNQPRTVVVAFEDDSPPYMFANEQGEVDGFGISLIKAIAEDQGFNIRFYEAPWSETRLALEQGNREIDAHTAMGYTQQRAQNVGFGVPYVKDEMALFARKGEPAPATLDDLRGKKILVLDSAICHDYLLEFAPDSIPVPVERWPEVQSRLANGEADYAMITRFAGLYFIKNLQLDNIEQVPLQAEGLKMSYALVVKKGDRDLLNMLNEGLTHLQGTGKYDQLYQQWLGVLEPTNYFSREALSLIAWVVSIGGAVFLLVFGWSLTLKVKVQQRTRTLQDEVAERMQAEKALRRSEARFRGLFMSAGMGMSVISRTGKFVSVNPRLCQLLGYSEAELKQHTLKDITHPEDLALMNTSFNNLFEQQHQPCQADIRYHDSQGKLLWGNTTGTIFSADGDDTLFCLYMIEDITARVEAESEREQMQLQLQQASKMEALGQLTGGIAHDFNNILASILGYTELAQDRCVEDGKGKLAKYLGNIHQAGERARDLIAQMMVFSRREVGTPVLFSPLFLIEEVLTFLQASLPSSIQVRVDPVLQVSPVYMDPVQLQRVLLNLCINSRDAISELGEINISVQDTCVEQQICTACGQTVSGNWVQISIADNGEGIEPEQLTQIFEPFFTTKEVGKGTGMGLSVVHGVIHEYHGHVLVESQPGQGSNFRLLLPAADDKQTNEAASIQARK